MKNVTLDRATVLQLDTDGTDSALDAAADCHVLRNDAALDLCAIADQVQSIVVGGVARLMGSVTEPPHPALPGAPPKIR
jgi:hypothetical protein